MKKLLDSEWKNIIGRLFISIVALLTIVVSTIAWFVSNAEAGSSGMEVEAKLNPSVVIAKSTKEIKKITDVEDSTISVSFASDSSKSLTPCRHNPECATGANCNTTDNTYIQVNKTSTAYIDYTTGLITKSSKASFQTLATSSASGYYRQYIVYIAATENSIDDATIEATISMDSTKTVQKASTVDFYCNGVYKGNLNVADARNGKTVTVFEGEIPYNKTGYITLLMRNYYDGGATDGTKAYINTNNMSTSEGTLTVTLQTKE